ncbi:hypothetical protein ACFS5L_41190 [Streptomyces phyllanthi]|uniref:Uncharacterized protein n=1 Tax=Streptomyces phyllanthi TaxID=1803180 RepID=A0A5N8WF11_9ACTN|nr:hypothetical protein [Streptomyces phyllanthi]MPY45078.1 hypothetical protein [Streptomyces phyllanthi]
MPQTTVRPSRSDGEFAELFARKARTPLRGFLPGRRVWNAVGGSAATVVVIMGTTALVSQIDWSGGPEKVTTAAEKKDAVKERGSAEPGGTPSSTTSSGAPAKEKGDRAPDVVYLPAPGGSGGSSGGGSGSSDSGSGTNDDEKSAGNDEQETSSRSTTSSQQESTSFLWSDGSVEADSNDYWDQSVITVKSTKSLSSLKVVVKIIQTGGVSNTGTWSSLGDRVSVASAATSGEVDYVVTLKSGVTLEPGTYVFKFQYNHDQGRRDAGGDRYNVTATTTSSESEFRKGSF